MTEKLVLLLVLRTKLTHLDLYLQHILDHFDLATYVVSDSSGDQDQAAAIQGFFKEKGLPGHYHQDAWVSWTHNQNQALAYAQGLGDYLIRLDGQRWLVGQADLGELTADFYKVLVTDQDGPEYLEPLIFKNDGRFQWQGIVLQTTDANKGISWKKLAGDLKLYKQVEIPKELAQRQDWEDLNLSSRPSETRNHQHSASESDGVLVNLLAFDQSPDQIQHIYYAAHTLKEEGYWVLAYYLLKPIIGLPRPSQLADGDQPVFDYLLDFDVADLAYRVGNDQVGFDALSRVLARNLPDSIRYQALVLLENYQALLKQLPGDLIKTYLSDLDELIRKDQVDERLVQVTQLLLAAYQKSWWTCFLNYFSCLIL